MKEIPGGNIVTPSGFRASGVRCGIKEAPDALDLALVVADKPCTGAGVFTTNQFAAGPVQWSRSLVPGDEVRAVVINSGNANCCTGERGLADAGTMASQVASSIGCRAGNVLVASTGKIGDPLPMDLIISGISKAVMSISSDREAGDLAARAIMTTDTRPKCYAIEESLDGRLFRVGGMAKGVGMIAPNMATMISVITTDVAVDAHALQTLTAETAQRTFNRVVVDGDTSTNDSVFVLSAGVGDSPVLRAGSRGMNLFATALEAVMLKLAKELVRDGEGATKFVEVRVTGAETGKEAEKVAQSIARSPLVKTALYGRDANWGRILAAAGYSGVPLDPGKVTLAIGGIVLFDSGKPTGADASAAMKPEEILLELDLGFGDKACSVWTCDLSHQYVTINAEYHT